METKGEKRVDVRLNEWAFDRPSAGFIINDGDVYVVYLWCRDTVPSLLEGDARDVVADRDPTYVFHQDVLDAERVDFTAATCFISHDGGHVECYDKGQSAVPASEVKAILARVDPRFREIAEEFTFD